MNHFRVVRKDNGARNPHTGLVSQHRTAAAAVAAVERANRKLRRQPGYSTARHPFEAQELIKGSWVPIAAEQSALRDYLAANGIDMPASELPVAERIFNAACDDGYLQAADMVAFASDPRHHTTMRLRTALELLAAGNL